MVAWLNELINAIKDKKELPPIPDDEADSEMEDEVMSEELGKF